ncbi:MAG: UTP--glucose-1-phosphate uridylyltransferase [Ignavibacteriae bacterium]|nr:UTP--glucose-1-phosphate uridylyltransferase [Ignavibacteriota bacterium]
MNETHIELFKQKMMDEKLPNVVLDTFKFYYNQLLAGESGMLSEDSIEAIDELAQYDDLGITNIGSKALHKTVVIKLNGGLGTSMGLSSAKSLLKVKDGLSFLDIIAKQAVASEIPLVLMNSYNTQNDSLEVLNKYPQLTNKLPLDFLQAKIPKINVNDFQPAEYSENTNLEWCPPGHGEIYTALVTSGMLTKLLDQNIEYAFISNSDNLGAVLDEKILGYFAENNFPFLMEVASRTAVDKKGGHLAKFPTGQLLLRESAQCPEQDLDEFQNISKHKYFNTNNIWVNLKALKKTLEEKNNILGLPMIVNKKTVNPKDSDSAQVYQLETAMGSAISVFKGATALAVPRTRFAPVKTTEDLLAVRSDNYILTGDFKVILNPERKLKPLVVRLDSKHYKLVDDMIERFPEAPSLIDCEELDIKGNYKFGKNIKLIGSIILENVTEKQIVIEDNIMVKE